MPQVRLRYDIGRLNPSDGGTEYEDGAAVDRGDVVHPVIVCVAVFVSGSDVVIAAHIILGRECDGRRCDCREVHGVEQCSLQG